MSISHSHIHPFDGSDYDSWRILMSGYLVSADEGRQWDVTETEWTGPLRLVDDSTTEYESIPASEWTPAQKADSRMNIKALHSIFMSLSPTERKRVIHCKTAHAAWNILAKTHEGNTQVKAHKLHALHNEFENIKMDSSESIDGFYTRLLNITNQCHGLGDSYADSKIVQKLLRSLPKVYEQKVTAIEEAHDLSTYALEVHVGNLKTYEGIKIKPKVEKSVALCVTKEEEQEAKPVKDEDNFEEIALIAKRINRFMSKRRTLPSSSKNFSKGTSSRFPKPHNSKYENIVNLGVRKRRMIDLGAMSVKDMGI